MTRCPTEQLEAFARGTLGRRAPRVAEHIEGCPRCAEELAWLRAEKRLFEAREPELPAPPAFGEVLARMSSPARSAEKPAPKPISMIARSPRPDAGRGLRRAVVPLALFAAAAAAIALFAWFEEEPPVAVGPEPPSTAAPAVDPQQPAVEPEYGPDCLSAPGFECGSCPSATEPEVPAANDDSPPRPLNEVCGNSDPSIDLSVTCDEDRPLPN